MDSEERLKRLFKAIEDGALTQQRAAISYLTKPFLDQVKRAFRED